MKTYSSFGGKGKMRKTMILIVMVLMTISFANAYTIVGDRVYVDDSKVYLETTPHTLENSGYVYQKLDSKLY